MIEQSAGHHERNDTMAGIAIMNAYRMAGRLTTRRTGTISDMTGIAARTRNIRAGMVGIGVHKTGRGMTVTAFGTGIRVGTALEGGCRLADSHRAVMTTAA